MTKVDWTFSREQAKVKGEELPCGSQSPCLMVSGQCGKGGNWGNRCHVARGELRSLLELSLQLSHRAVGNFSFLLGTIL